MKFDDKRLYIDNQKIKLELLIEELKYQQPINISEIINISIEHYNFTNFIEFVNIFEDYKWNTIKESYNKLKKKINLDKKIYPKIIKIYGIINCYYSSDQINDKNKMITKLYDENYILNIEWKKIQKLHTILINKRKNYMRNKSIIKIYKSNNDILILMNKLEEIYIELKKLKKNNLK